MNTDSTLLQDIISLLVAYLHAYQPGSLAHTNLPILASCHRICTRD